MDLSNKCLTELPTDLHENVIDFDCSCNKLSNLKGSPEEVAGYFNCSDNELTNLIGSPNHVGVLFDCSNNKLTNLIGSPNHAGIIFNCSSNKLTNLIGSLNYIDDFDCSHNNLTSLFGVPKKIKVFFCVSKNPNLLDISDIWESDIKGKIYFDLNPGMALLPLIKFKSSCSYSGNATNEIHKRNQGSSKQNIFDFQYDLIENGFEKHAKWKP